MNVSSSWVGTMRYCPGGCNALIDTGEGIGAEGTSMGRPFRRNKWLCLSSPLFLPSLFSPPSCVSLLPSSVLLPGTSYILMPQAIYHGFVTSVNNAGGSHGCFLSTVPGLAGSGYSSVTCPKEALSLLPTLVLRLATNGSSVAEYPIRPSIYFCCGVACSGSKTQCILKVGVTPSWFNGWILGEWKEGGGKVKMKVKV
jgi:hypothetical protein